MNKTIFICWFQGFESAPKVVKHCLMSWKINNPTWNVIELTDKNIKNYVDIEKDIPNIHKKNISLPHLADIIRVHLLVKYGGLWCDATTLCTVPLDKWLNEYIETGFFTFRSKKSKNSKILGNWFMYCEKNNYIMSEWKKKIDKFWNNNNVSKQYFIHQKIFKTIYNSNKSFKKEFISIKLFEKKETFRLGFGKRLISDVTKKIKTHINSNKVPVYKLTYKYKESLNIKNSRLNYILKTKANVDFIHIGKCGGTTVADYFNFNREHRKININKNLYTVIWLRNPISRLVSAFNYAKYIINFDYKSVKNVNNLNLNNNIGFEIIRRKIKNKKKYAFSREFDKLINSFKNANDFFESLTSNNIKKKTKSLRLIEYSNGLKKKNNIKFFKNISFYLNNGTVFNERNKQHIFIGRCENINNDINNLSKIIKVKKQKISKKRNNTHYSTKLSSLAIKNIKNVFEKTEYVTLKSMLDHGLISNKIYNDYHKY